MFVPIQNTTHFSLRNSISSPSDLAKHAQKQGYTSLGITDYHSLSGAVEFSTACKDKKVGIKPIFGTKLRTSPERYLTLIAKNLQGWKTLIKMISNSNSLESMVNHQPVLSKIDDYDLSNLLVILGDLESELFHQCFSYHGFMAPSDAVASLAIPSDIENSVREYIQSYYKFFNKESIFVQVNLLNSNHIPYQKLITDILRSAAKKEGIKCIAGVNTHYAKKEDATDHRLLMCCDQGTTFKEISLDYWRNHIFFKSDDFYLPPIEKINECYTEEEIKNTELVDSLCEKYDITSKPKLPAFSCPGTQSELEYLTQLARDGYKLKNKGWDKDLYGSRVKQELAVIEKAGLAGYFLIVQDYVNWAKSQGCLVGPARGSAAGSLVSYLVGITTVNPIPFNLLFERFYNEGRNTEGNVAYPDIDMDFPKFFRENVINYIRGKYGQNHFAHICTFGKLEGRSAIREVLRIQNVCDTNTINQISKKLPEKNKITDKLEEAKEDSIIRWTLTHEPERLKDFCSMDDQGNLVGDLAQYFEQAIRIEGVYKTQGKHAAGIVICQDNIGDICPMIYHDESKEKITGLDMKSVEKVGLVKLDVLGVAALDKLQYVNNLLRGI